MRFSKFYVMLRVCASTYKQAKLTRLMLGIFDFFTKSLPCSHCNAVAQYSVSFVIVRASVGRLIEEIAMRKNEKEMR